MCIKQRQLYNFCTRLLQASARFKNKMASLCDYKTFDVSTITVSAPKELKFVNVFDIKTQEGKPVIIVSPKLRLSMGIFAVDFGDSKFRKGQRVTEVANATKVTLPLSVDLPGEDGYGFLEFMSKVDTRIKQLLYDNAAKWFKKDDVRFITHNISDLFTPCVKPAEKYPALFSPKIAINEDKITTQFFDSEGTFIPDPINFVQQNNMAKVAFEITGINQVASSMKFYVNVKAVQVKVFPPENSESPIEHTVTCMI